MRGKIAEKVQAKTIPSTELASAIEGLYDRG